MVKKLGIQKHLSSTDGLANGVEERRLIGLKLEWILNPGSTLNYILCEHVH